MTLDTTLLNDRDIARQADGFDYNDPFYQMPKIYKIDRNIIMANFHYMKVLPAFYAINKAINNGQLQDGDSVIETTSGNFGYGLALAWSNRPQKNKSRKNDVRLVTYPGGIDGDFQQLLESYGATLDIVYENINGSYQVTRLQHLAREIERIKNDTGRMPYWPQQYDNTDMRLGYHYFGEYVIDICRRHFNTVPDIFVTSVGTGASAAGTAEIIRKHNPACHVAAVDPQGSVVLGKNYIRGPVLIGSGGIIKCRNTNYDLIDESHWIDQDQAVYQMQYLNQFGINSGYSTGGVFHVAQWHARRNPDKLVFMIGPDCVDRYVSKLLTDDSQKAYGIIPQDLAEPEHIHDPNIYTKPQQGHGWQVMNMTEEWRSKLKARAQEDYLARSAYFKHLALSS